MNIKTNNKLVIMYTYMNRPTRKPTVLSLRKVSTRISLIMPRRFTRTYTFRLLWFFCSMNHYSESIHYAKSTMLVFSWNGSSSFFIIYLKVEFLVYMSCLNPFPLANDFWSFSSRRQTTFEIMETKGIITHSEQFLHLAQCI